MKERVFKVGDVFEAQMTYNPRATDEARLYNFAPTFIDGSMVCENGMVMQIFRIENLDMFLAPMAGEIWQAKVVRIHVAHDSPKTKDERTKVLVYVDLIKRVERTEYPWFNKRDGYVSIERWSGDRKVSEQRVPATSQTRSYRYPRGVVEVEEVIVSGVIVSYQWPRDLSENDYLNILARKIGRTADVRALRRVYRELPEIPEDLRDYLTKNKILANRISA